MKKKDKEILMSFSKGSSFYSYKTNSAFLQVHCFALKHLPASLGQLCICLSP